MLWKCGEILEIAEDKLFGLALRQPTEGIGLLYLAFQWQTFLLGNDQPRHEYFFLDPAQKIVKYAPKQPRFANWVSFLYMVIRINRIMAISFHGAKNDSLFLSFYIKYTLEK